MIENKGKDAKVIINKNFGQNKINDTITINNFFLLNYTSNSGENIKFPLTKGTSYYLFLKKNDSGSFSLPTPTSGFANIDENKKVYATYRHSYHMALIPQNIYEMTYKNIWNYYKNKKFDKEEIMTFINKELSEKPATFDDKEIDTFFLQHSALETAYLLDLAPNLYEVLKFAKSDNFHSKVSAIQLLGNYKNEKAESFLFSIVQNDEFDNFQKVVAIWALKKSNNKKYIQKLKEVKNKLSDKAKGFGGNLMDPRVGTHFPSPKEAVEKI
ncbi:hypothetical protein [Chryseobacterium sp. RR2-3-20]|uniref:hypothetical protein n=1 Tax=Chryseobacterium sp. RR2-3-20 TaxID=2787626 RepID=UPI001AE0D96D|nr:hypothetical protein [Chryseobacterium sp. RR2-3-20]